MRKIAGTRGNLSGLLGSARDLLRIELMAHAPKTVGELMTREVMTLYEEDNLDRIEEGMNRFRFRHLPVVDGKRLVGLVTHRDIQIGRAHV